MVDADVAIVGGGISGLSAARVLAARGLRVRLFERDASCGGVIKTDRIAGFVIDSGPDTLLAHKPAALALVSEVGLDCHLVSPSRDRTTYVLRNTRLRSLPETSALGLPVDVKSLLTARAFTWRGRIRMAAEPMIPAGAPAADESLSSFVGRRFGPEAVTYVAEPLLAGLHRGEAARLSVRALFPALAQAEREHGSVARAWRKRRAQATAGSMSLRDGLGELAARLEEQLTAAVVTTGSEIRRVERNDAFTLTLADGATVRARAVLLATPAYETASLTAGLDRRLSELCGAIRYAPSISVALGYRRQDVGNALRGWGFVVPARARKAVTSASWVSSKWPDRAPSGHVLIRAAVAAGRAADGDDEATIAGAHQDLAELLNIRGAPVIARAYCRPRAMPQMEVGHLDRMAAIDGRLGSIPGLFISASGFRSIGLADCIADAHATADRLASHLRPPRSHM